MWYLIVSVPDHCLSFYFDEKEKHRKSDNAGRIINNNAKDNK